MKVLENQSNLAASRDLLDPKSKASFAISKVFRLSFLDAHMVVSHAKEYFMTIIIPITQNMSDCNGQPPLEITPNAVSESLYFMFGSYISPIFSLH